jgi:DNA-binding NtrC family response regulator
VLEQVERRLITLALRRHQGNKSKAAQWLGLWRPRLLRRMEALGIKDDGSLISDS